MAKRVGISASGCNSAGDLSRREEYDCFCPWAGSVDARGFNFWKSSCDLKKTMIEHKSTCYPYCKSNKTDRAKSAARIKETNKSSKERLKISIEIAKEFIDLAEKGCSRTEIAKLYEVSSSTVTKYIKLAGGMKSTGYARYAKRWRQMRENGVLTGVIAEQYGVSNTTVRRVIREYKKGLNLEKEI